MLAVVLGVDRGNSKKERKAMSKVLTEDDNIQGKDIRTSTSEYVVHLDLASRITDKIVRWKL